MNKNLRFVTLCRLGSSLNLLKIIFLSVTTGIIYLFLPIVPKEQKFFGHPLNISNNILKTYYSDNFLEFLKEYGIFLNAKKHGLIYDQNMIMEHLKTVFSQKDGTFKKEDLDEFCKKNKITMGEVINYYNINLTATLYKKLLMKMNFDFQNSSIYNKINHPRKKILFGVAYKLKMENIKKNEKLLLYIKENNLSYCLDSEISPLEKRDFLNFCFEKKFFDFVEQASVCGTIYEIESMNIEKGIKNPLNKIIIKNGNQSDILVNKCLFLYENQIVEYNGKKYVGIIDNFSIAIPKCHLNNEELNKYILAWKEKNNLWIISQKLMYDFNSKKIDQKFLELFGVQEEIILDSSIEKSALINTSINYSWAYKDYNSNASIFVAEKCSYENLSNLDLTQEEIIEDFFKSIVINHMESR